MKDFWPGGHLNGHKKQNVAQGPEYHTMALELIHLGLRAS